MDTSSWWIEIEGVAGRFGYGDPGSSPGHQFRPEGADRDDMARQASTIDDSTDPITSELDLSSFSFEVNAHPSNVELLLFQQTQPATFLQQGVTSDGDENSLFFEDDLDLEEGDSVYIGMETYRITDASDTDSYLAANGQYGSANRSHESGEAVYTRVPRWRGRRVELWTEASIEGAPNDTRRRWVGYLESISRSGDGSTIKIDARNVWTAIMDTTAGATQDLTGNASIDIYYDSVLYPGVDNWPDKRAKGSARTDTPFLDASEGEKWLFQMSDVVVAGEITQINEVVYDDHNSWDVDFNDVPTLGSFFDSSAEVGEFYRWKVRPLFSITGDILSEDGVIASRSGDVITGADTPYNAHPINIALFLLTDYIIDENLDAVRLPDRAPFHTLSLGGLFGSELRDTAADLIERDPELQVDHFVLGWDGEDYEVVDVVATKLLRPYSYFFGLTQEGFPTFQRFGIPTAVDIEEVENNPDRIVEPLTHPWVGDYDPRYDDSVDGLTAKVGGVPWIDEPDTIRVENLGSNAGRTRLGDDNRWELDFETISIYSENVEDLIDELDQRASLAAFGFPRFRFRAPDAPDGTYDVGGYIRLDRMPVRGGYLLDQSGNLVEDITEDRSQIQFYAMIVGREFIPESHHYELDVMLTSWRTAPMRLRAPAAIVDSSVEDSGTYTVTVDDVDGFYTVEENNGFDFLANIDPADNSYDVLICDDTLEAKGEQKLVDVTSDGELVIDSSSTTIEAGDIVRLGTFDANAQLPTTGLVAYNFCSNDGGSDPLHEYGV